MNHLTPKQEINDDVVLNMERNSATEIRMWKVKGHDMRERAVAK